MLIDRDPTTSASEESLLARIKFFLTPVDGRYEDLKDGDWRLKVFRDFTAGLIVAMVAIPLAMGFAMASGLRPEQGIVGGADRRPDRRAVRRLEVSGLRPDRRVHPCDWRTDGEVRPFACSYSLRCSRA